MTHDTDQDNDPFKISIALEAVRMNYARKKFFEKGLGTLLADEHFLLLYVPDNGAKMKIIRPASDPYHRQRMIKRINEAQSIPSFYYALSHLWGVTEENRYYWNDISQYVDDEEGQPVKPVFMRPEKRDTLLTMLRDHPDSYWWVDVLCARTDTPLDIMGNIYACCLECVAMIDCQPSLIPQINTAISTYPFTQGSLVHGEKLRELVALYLAMMQSQWWSRVWTWQEMVLPFGKVRFMSETGTHLQGNTITFENLCDSYLKLLARSSFIENHRPMQDAMMVKDWVGDIANTKLYFKNRVSKVGVYTPQIVLLALSKSTRRCMDPVDYVYGVLGIFQIKMPRLKDPNAVWQLFLTKIQDHVEERWSQSILTQEISPRAQRVDLLNVENMGDVYKDFIKFSDA
ncbi:hypothetical protein LRAMOSA11294 [Lichtheimia ramosa]|uniref:Heterokaryon incompatibility domain-containing protein n=1 Tax=Lichtheimia ramosa TaxID=688394 RepID=A0A077WUU3_9FUNG|nr:hypothetical protein LRAMOSA11294 [Lichtheimia ramosa]